MNPEMLRNYLAWQSDIGCDEVILPHPMLRKQAVPGQRAAAHEIGGAMGSVAGQSGEGLTGQAFQHAPAFRPTSPSNLFGDLARDLEVAVKSATKSQTGPAGPSKILRAAEQAPLPTFTAFPEFWEYVEKNARALFASETDPRILRGIGPELAPLALISMEPNDSDMAAGRLFSGEAGLLLEKMMRAIRLDTGSLYQSSLVKHRVGNRVWSRRELIRMLPILHNELALANAPITLLLGEPCAQAVLKTTKTMEELRQIPHREGGREFVVTYHPDDLLRRDEWKRKAWEDLQWLQRRMGPTQVQK